MLIPPIYIELLVSNINILLVSKKKNPPAILAALRLVEMAAAYDTLLFSRKLNI
jgi:hypothetical protein